MTSGELLAENTARTAYNYSLSDGSLKTGIGLSPAKMPGSFGEAFEIPGAARDIRQMFFYTRFDGESGVPDDRLFILDKQGYSFDTPLLRPGPLSQIILPRQITARPDALNYRYNGKDVLLFASSGIPGLYIFDGEEYDYLVHCLDAPSIRSMCLHYERVYACLTGDKTAVWFSDAFDPTNWNVSLDEGGFIEFADEGGYVRKVLQLNDSVYIFRDFSIERLIAYGEQREFSLGKVCLLGSKIIPATVCQCGSCAVFMQRDGLYRFDGITPKKIFEKVTDMIDTDSELRACANGDKYYLSARADFGDGELVAYESDGKKNALFEFDLKSGGLNILRGVCVEDLLTVKMQTAEKVLACVSGCPAAAGRVLEIDSSGRVMDTALPALWASAHNTGGAPDLRKLVRRVFMTTKYDLTLVLTADGQRFEYSVKGSEKPSAVNINKICRSFSIAFESLGAAEISNAVAEVDLLN